MKSMKWIALTGIAATLALGGVGCGEDNSTDGSGGQQASGGTSQGGANQGGTSQGGSGGSNAAGSGGSNAAGTGGASGGSGGATGGTGGSAGGGGGASGGSGGGTGGSAGASGAIIADHEAADAFDKIPEQYITDAISKWKIWYGHTSHGSQIVTGMKYLANNPGGVYQYPAIFMVEKSGDLGHNGDTAWADMTRTKLDDPHNDRNMVMWSWCGGVSDNTTAGIQTYLDEMGKLEKQYPNVTFVYMTGHTDQWEVDNTRKNNQQIRDWCKDHGKILFDFEDIESWDPDGNFYKDTGDDCKWCSDWCSAHAGTDGCDSCGNCAHSHCFNCYRKGRAFWWMMARVSGWTG